MYSALQSIARPLLGPVLRGNYRKELLPKFWKQTNSAEANVMEQPSSKIQWMGNLALLLTYFCAKLQATLLNSKLPLETAISTLCGRSPFK